MSGICHTSHCSSELHIVSGSPRDVYSCPVDEEIREFEQCGQD